MFVAFHGSNLGSYRLQVIHFADAFIQSDLQGANNRDIGTILLDS